MTEETELKVPEGYRVDRNGYRLMLVKEKDFGRNDAIVHASCYIRDGEQELLQRFYGQSLEDHLVKPGYVGLASELVKFMEGIVETEEASIDLNHWDEASQVRLETLHEVLDKANKLMRGERMDRQTVTVQLSVRIEVQWEADSEEKAINKMLERLDHMNIESIDEGDWRLFLIDPLVTKVYNKENNSTKHSDK